MSRLVYLLTGLLLLSSSGIDAYKKPGRRASLKGNYYFAVLPVFHSASIYFINDSLYQYFGRSEYSAFYHLGHWSTIGDTLRLRPDTLLLPNPVKFIAARRAGTDSLRAMIIDQNGHNISEHFYIGCRMPGSGTFISQYNSKLGVQSLNVRPKGVPVLYTLERAFRRSFPLPADTASYFEVHLDIPDYIPVGVSWGDAGPMDLIIHDDRLAPIITFGDTTAYYKRPFTGF